MTAKRRSTLVLDASRYECFQWFSNHEASICPSVLLTLSGTSNAAQLITSVSLLRDNQIDVLQTTLVGNILSSMHLMLGISFLLGGYNRPEQHYNLLMAQVSANLLLLSMVGLILPTMGRNLEGLTESHILRLSRGIAFMFLFIYATYTFFTQRSHVALYNQPSKKVQKQDLVRRQNPAEEFGLARGIASVGASGTLQLEPPANTDSSKYEDEVDHEEVPALSLVAIILCLIMCTTLVTFNTTFATNSLSGLFLQTGISPTFVGIVLLPLLSNDITVIVPAVKDQMDQVVVLTIGKCLQTILIIVPLTVLLGWIIDRPMSLDFDEFEVVALFASVLYINSIIGTGKSTYLDGFMLLCVFLIICLVSFWVP